jgi:hypothetical protein
VRVTSGDGKFRWRGLAPYLPLTTTTLMVATPTVLPRPPLFPTLMPRQQQPYPTPLAIPGRRIGKLILRRDLVQEMDDLSDEEAELEDGVRTTSLLFEWPLH